MKRQRKKFQAIETKFDGYYFRSRLEARWALFFRTLKVPYEYEKEGYDLCDLGWYLCDFWLPTEAAWIEVKGKAPTTDEIQKLMALSVITPCRAAFVYFGAIPDPRNWRKTWKVYSVKGEKPILTHLTDEQISHAFWVARAARF